MDRQRTGFMNVVLAAHTREMKTALYLALNASPNITVVATATSTAELISYCHAFLPDVAIVESGLPGRSLGEALSEFDRSAAPQRILMIGGDEVAAVVRGISKAEVLRDIDHLTGMLPDFELEGESR